MSLHNMKEGLTRLFKSLVLLSIASTLLLTGCSTLSSAPQVTVQTQELPKFHPPRPDPIALEDVSYVVLTAENVQPLIATQGDKFLYVALTWSDYLKIGRNMLAIKSYIKQTNTLLCYYRQDVKEIYCPVVEDKKETGSAK